MGPHKLKRTCLLGDIQTLVLVLLLQNTALLLLIELSDEQERLLRLLVLGKRLLLLSIELELQLRTLHIVSFGRNELVQQHLLVLIVLPEIFLVQLLLVLAEQLLYHTPVEFTVKLLVLWRTFVTLHLLL
jgi:hypothetical protein